MPVIRQGELQLMDRKGEKTSLSADEHKVKMEKLAGMAGGLMESLTDVREKEKKGEVVSAQDVDTMQQKLDEVKRVFGVSPAMRL